MPPTTDIAPSSDVTLIIGPDKASFKVYSQVLKISSKVFAAMLNRQFREGQSLLQHGSTTIPLPEDDPEAMETLLRVLHGSDSWTHYLKFDGGHILRVAIATDKYDCNVAMGPVARICLGTAAKNEEIKTEELLDWLMAAYWLEDHQGFEELSLRLVMEHQGSYLTACKADSSNLDLETLFQILASLEEQRNKLRESFLRITFQVEGDWIGPADCRCEANVQKGAIASLSSVSEVTKGLFSQSVDKLLHSIGSVRDSPRYHDESCADWQNGPGKKYDELVNRVKATNNSAYAGLKLEHFRSTLTTNSSEPE